MAVVAPAVNVNVPEAPVEETVPAPANVKAVALVLIVSSEATPVKAPPVVTFRPPDEVNWNVPVALPIVVAAVPVELIKVVPKIVVEPLMAFVPPETPKVLIAPVPVPKVLVKEAPVPMVEAPDEVKVVKLPAPAVIPAVQANAPVELVKVQPVEPDPPPRRMFPVDTDPILIAPVVPASRLMAVPTVDTEMVGAVEVKVMAVAE